MWKARANFGKGLKGFSMHDECDLRLDLRRDLRRACPPPWYPLAPTRGEFPSVCVWISASISALISLDLPRYGVAMYGVAAADARLRDLGRLMLATEVRAAHHYWQVRGPPHTLAAPRKTSPHLP